MPSPDFELQAASYERLIMKVGKALQAAGFQYEADNQAPCPPNPSEFVGCIEELTRTIKRLQAENERMEAALISFRDGIETFDTSFWGAGKTIAKNWIRLPGLAYELRGVDAEGQSTGVCALIWRKEAASWTFIQLGKVDGDPPFRQSHSPWYDPPFEWAEELVKSGG